MILYAACFKAQHLIKLQYIKIDAKKLSDFIDIQKNTKNFFLPFKETLDGSRISFKLILLLDLYENILFI